MIWQITTVIGIYLGSIIPEKLGLTFAIPLTFLALLVNDFRKFINILEESIIDALCEYKIRTKSDRKKIGIWYIKNKKLKKVAAIGIKVRKWVAYHGFSLNISNDLGSYKKIIPCGIMDREVTNLSNIKKQDYSKISHLIEKYLIKKLKI